MPRKLYVYIAASLDGYIAKHDDDISFLSLVEQPGEDYGYAGFIDTIDTVIIGRKTYDKVQAMGIEYL
ncbi:MAG: dihydrofolate reductase, partial [Dyadobacter fermentans]